MFKLFVISLSGDIASKQKPTKTCTSSAQNYPEYNVHTIDAAQQVLGKIMGNG